MKYVEILKRNKNINFHPFNFCVFLRPAWFAIASCVGHQFGSTKIDTDSGVHFHFIVVFIFICVIPDRLLLVGAIWGWGNTFWGNNKQQNEMEGRGEERNLRFGIWMDVIKWSLKGHQSLGWRSKMSQLICEGRGPFFIGVKVKSFKCRKKQKN